MSKKIVIVGGVAAGATAAAKARRLDEKAEITIIEKGKYISFANCGLPYYTGGIIEERSKILLHTKKTFSKRFNANVMLETECTGVDRRKKQVICETQAGIVELNYDKLILAPGASMIIPPIEGISDVPFFTMRTVDDADSVKEFIEEKKPETAVIIGGGFIGIETAEAMMHCGIKTTIIEAAPEIMPQFNRVVAQNLREKIENSGITVVCGHFVTKAEENDGKVILSLSNGVSYETDMVFLSTGVRPKIKLAREADLEIAETGGIAVNEKMETSDPDIYAAGDAVEKLNLLTGKKQLLPLAGPANREGRTAGANAVGVEASFPGIIGTSIVGFDGFAAAQTGLTYEQAIAAGFDADYIYTEDADISEYYPGYKFVFMVTVFDKKTKRLLGMSASGKNGVDKRIDTAAVAIQAKMTVEDLQNLEFAYAPQFAAAKDNLNIAGYVAMNKINGNGFLVNPEYYLETASKTDHTLLDVRTVIEYKIGALEGALNVYLNDIRKKIDKIDPSKPVYIYCAVGMRGHQAVRILRQLGYEAYNISGGIEAINRVKKIV